MANSIKDQQDILEKLNIYALNPMQEEALDVIENNDKMILLSPTGTGKTLAFFNIKCHFIFLSNLVNEIR